MPFLFLLCTHVLGFHYQGEVNSCFWHNCNFESCHFYPAYEVRNQRTGNNDRLTDLNSIPGPFPYRQRWKKCSLSVGAVLRTVCTCFIQLQQSCEAGTVKSHHTGTVPCHINIIFRKGENSTIWYFERPFNNFYCSVLLELFCFIISC